MAVAEQAIETILEAASGVTTLIDGSSVYAVKAPQGTGDCVTYQRISSDRQHAMGADTGLVSVRVQVTAWAKHYASAQAIANAVRAALQDYSGTSAGVVIQRMFLDGEHSLGFIEDAYGFAQEYEIWHRE